MKPKMVANFRRSLSFPNSPNSTTSSSSKPKKTFHVRSTSLPSRPHVDDPLVFQLRHAINELKIWIPGDGNVNRHITNGLSQLKSVHDSLDDFLDQLPQTRESLDDDRQEFLSIIIEKFLEDFLRLIDVYEIFQNLIIRLKEVHSSAQVSLRKKDYSKIQIYLNTVKKISKEMSKLVSSAAAVQSTGAGKYTTTAEGITGIIRDVIQVTVSVSVALFRGLSVSLSSHQKYGTAGRSGFKKLLLVNYSSSSPNNNNSSAAMDYEGFKEFEGIWRNLRIKEDDEELKLTTRRMHEIEECIRGIEIGSEKAFRSLINTRVSLMNVLTH